MAPTVFQGQGRGEIKIEMEEYAQLRNHCCAQDNKYGQENGAQL